MELFGRQMSGDIKELNSCFFYSYDMILQDFSSFFYNNGRLVCIILCVHLPIQNKFEVILADFCLLLRVLTAYIFSFLINIRNLIKCSNRFIFIQLKCLLFRAY